MADIERVARTWVATQRDEEIDQTVLEITNRRLTWLNVVKALGEYLTSEDDELRRKGIDFLASVLTKAPSSSFNVQSTRVLISFMCSKLDDTETVIPALKGLVPLSALPAAEAQFVVRALFTHVKIKALIQSVRYNVFTIIDTLVARHREDLKDMNTEFLDGYLRLADGEKDPRNLLVAFAVARVILIEFNISSHIERLFEITYCYFPITFRPPPNDPYGITTDDLRAALRRCLSATPAFGPMAIPIFLEKLMAGTPMTKRDVLQTMSICFPVYGAAVARANGRKLWNALKLEIFQPTDTVTEAEALKTTQELVKTIYEESSADDSDVQGLAREACEECIGILKEPEKSQAKYAIKVLCAFMSTTPSVSRYTLAQVVPHLLKLFNTPDEISTRPAILQLLSEVIQAGRDSSLKEVDGDAPLAPYKDEVLGAMTVGLKSPSSRPSALSGITGLVTTPGLITDDEIGFIVHNLSELIQSGLTEEDESGEEVLALLAKISENTPRHVEEQLLPVLFAALPDRAPGRDANTERVQVFRVLVALKALCRQPVLFGTLVSRLTTKLDLVCTAPVAADGIELAVAYAHALLRTLSQTLSAKIEAKHVDVAKYIDRLVPLLFNLFIFSALSGLVVGTDARLVDVAGDIITMVVQALSAARQETFVKALFPAYIEGDVSGIAEGQQKIPPSAEFAPLKDGAPASQKGTVALLASAVVALHSEVVLPLPDTSVFVTNTIWWSLRSAETDLQRSSAWHICASVVNKRVTDVPSFLESGLQEFWTAAIESKSADTTLRQHALKGWAWICRALLVRNHAGAAELVNKLFGLFDDSTVSWDAAKVIGQIGRADTVLTKRNHAVIRILYLQKYVNSILPRIMSDAAGRENPVVQTASLVAVTSLITAVPKATYTQELDSLFPLLLRALDLPDPDLRASVIETLLAINNDDAPESSRASEHASTLVSVMLKNCTVDSMPTTRVRIAALRYLSILPRILMREVMQRYKATVTKDLAKTLDDPKKVVRKEAVTTRTKWFTA
ncbi:RNAPII transcription regulator C-terminal-domain-containing protein [Schizophyllum amplum]|uniref:MMS19 nucleotide excision repair protein n=1 Tax=Schizophyllum amplum TaxID=97359 RepID=A0A550C7G0_9AGAR|nr:RNAPII transcription regulator C-terminal-domain-containing protein [Auriculariopsis ampla]